MHFRHRQTDRQMDTDIVAYARDVYITSRAKNVKLVYYFMIVCRSVGKSGGK